MKCPFCEHEMSEGILKSGRYIMWKGAIGEGRERDYLLQKSYMGDAKLTGWICAHCRKAVLDIPDLE